MQTINIICVGKLKEQYLKDAQKEYATLNANLKIVN